MREGALGAAWEQGHQAFRDGIRAHDNPFTDVFEFDLWESWHEGWYSAYEDFDGEQPEPKDINIRNNPR